MKKCSHKLKKTDTKKAVWRKNKVFNFDHDYHAHVSDHRDHLVDRAVDHDCHLPSRLVFDPFPICTLFQLAPAPVGES